MGERTTTHIGFVEDNWTLGDIIGDDHRLRAPVEGSGRKAEVVLVLVRSWRAALLAVMAERHPSVEVKFGPAWARGNTPDICAAIAAAPTAPDRDMWDVWFDLSNDAWERAISVEDAVVEVTTSE